MTIGALPATRVSAPLYPNLTSLSSRLRQRTLQGDNGVLGDGAIQRTAAGDALRAALVSPWSRKYRVYMVYRSLIL